MSIQDLKQGSFVTYSLSNILPYYAVGLIKDIA